jgi:hypothetical protein
LNTLKFGEPSRKCVELITKHGNPRFYLIFHLVGRGERPFDSSSVREIESTGIIIDRLESARQYRKAFVRVSVNDELLSVAQCTAESEICVWREAIRLECGTKKRDRIKFTLMDSGEQLQGPANVITSTEVKFTELLNTRRVSFPSGEVLHVEGFVPGPIFDIAPLAPGPGDSVYAHVCVMDIKDFLIREKEAVEFYWVVKEVNRKESTQYGHLTKGFSDVTWRQTFSFPFLSLQDDVIRLKLKKKANSGKSKVL